MNGDRRPITEAANHRAKSNDCWGELKYARDGRRSIYWITRMVRGGWSFCVWKRWIPRTNNEVRLRG